MRYTVFDTPVVKQIFTVLAKIGLKLKGWEVVGDKPADKKYVLIAGPHTSNWDFLLLVSAAFTLDLKIYWMGKHTIFKPPFAGLVKWFGGVPVIRSKSNNLVEQMVGHYNDSDSMVLTIPAEGTRGKTNFWKTGFYQIAQKANVPIGMSFVDYKNKKTGIGPMFTPTGDLREDKKHMVEFYGKITGAYPELACPPRFRELEEDVAEVEALTKKSS